MRRGSCPRSSAGRRPTPAGSIRSPATSTRRTWSATIGADVTTLRIGDTAFLSMPGEPFPEIRAALANATTGAGTIVALSKGQDDWGYFYPAWAWGFTSLYTSDHNTYNVAPQAGDQVILQQADNLRALGFTAETAVGIPLPTRWEQALRPGIQAMASPTWGTASAATGTLAVTFTAIYDPAYVTGPRTWRFTGSATG